MKNLEKYIINFDELKVGDTVWHNTLGEVEISSIDNNSKSYPIIIPSGRYTKDGKFATAHRYPTIYKSNPFLDLKEEPRMIGIRHVNGYVKRELILVHEGRALVWDDNKTIAFFVDEGCWQEIQPKEEPLTLEQRIEKLEKRFETLTENKIILGTAIGYTGVPKFTSTNDVPSKDYLKEQIDKIE